MSSCLDSALYFQFISTLVAIVMMQVSAQCQVISTTSEIRKNSGCIKQMQPLLTSTKASHCGYEQGGIAVFHKPLPRHHWAVTSQTTKNTESKADKKRSEKFRFESNFNPYKRDQFRSEPDLGQMQVTEYLISKSVSAEPQRPKTLGPILPI